MGVCVKLASSDYGTGEIVFYRGLLGVVLMAGAARLHGGSLKTRVAGMHFWRSIAGVAGMCFWFYALAHLPLATAVTLNYMSSVWIAVFMLGGAALLGSARVDPRLVVAVLLGFAGVALVLRPTIEQQQLWHGLVGLMSGVVAAAAYLQVGALGRAGEPEYRTVFYFSLGGALVGLVLLAASGGFHPLDLRGFALLIGNGVLATAGQLLMTRAYSTGRALVNASLQYLAIAFSFGYGVWLFDDPVTATAIAGMLLIVAAGVFASLLRVRRAVVPASDPVNTA
ncbi:DMT family transporter [Schlegelella sp. ID0723]|uniref:DMT family transporter n=2 Tax=Piscinibacter koreensis TaxID=2742824 RepID=A0A7Y6TVS0_9BURK|nr:DMT family transporter [Schlegelella koreensis]NUZ05404.1 DMT family transporter [Schlegelella koreensis]